MLNAYIALGCNGHVGPGGFLYCNSLSNPILDLSAAKKQDRKRLEDFLDRTCRLFDEVCTDYNKTINIINMIYRDFGIMSDESLHEIQAFIRMHKVCGIYIMLILKEDYENVRFKNTLQ